MLRCKIDNNEFFKYIWLAVVAFVGSATGCLAKVKDWGEKSFSEKAKLFSLGVTTSMFISYITYECAFYYLQANGICVALAGLASFMGTDFVVVLEKAALDFIIRKFKSL